MLRSIKMNKQRYLGKVALCFLFLFFRGVSIYWLCFVVRKSWSGLLFLRPVTTFISVAYRDEKSRRMVWREVWWYSRLDVCCCWRWCRASFLVHFTKKVLSWSELGMLIEDVKGFFVLNWDQSNFHYVKVDTNGPAKYLFT